MRLRICAGIGMLLSAVTVSAAWAGSCKEGDATTVTGTIRSFDSSGGNSIWLKDGEDHSCDIFSIDLGSAPIPDACKVGGKVTASGVYEMEEFNLELTKVNSIDCAP